MEEKKIFGKKNYTPLFPNKPGLHCLEIGSYLYCVDPWSMICKVFNKSPKKLSKACEKCFLRNTKKKRKIGKIKVLKGFSADKIHDLMAKGLQFDFIYIDGDHSYEAAKKDAKLCLPLLSKNGIMLIDDYQGIPSVKRP